MSKVNLVDKFLEEGLHADDPKRTSGDYVTIDELLELGLVTKINGANIHLLTPGTEVFFSLGYPHNTKDLKRMKVVKLHYGFIDYEPLVETDTYSHMREGNTVIHSSHGYIIGESKKGLVKKEYQPHSMVFNTFYGVDNYVPMFNFVYKTLFNKYGHRNSWKDTLYDIKVISLFLEKDIFDNARHNVKYLRKKVIALASKHKIKRSIVITEDRVLWEDMMDSEYCYDEDYAEAERVDKISDEERSGYSRDIESS